MNDTHVDLYLKGGNLNEYPAIFVLGIFWNSMQVTSHVMYWCVEPATSSNIMINDLSTVHIHV